MPDAYAAAVEPATQAHHHALLEACRISVEWRDLADGLVECTVVAPDRTGLLATVAGALALCGLDIRDAACFSHRDGMALEVFTGTDRFGRLAAADGRARAAAMLADALGGRLALDARLRDRARRYRPSAAAAAVSVELDPDASDVATVVEVHAPDEVGLLARLAATFTDLDLDVVLAKVATLGDRVVDVFYVQDRTGTKVTEQLALDRLRATLMARLTRDLVLP
jgi:[protein-PII] uridylyltransferase